MDQVTAGTRIVGLIGWPVSHSVSPRMHNTAFAALGLDWKYLPFPVNPHPETRVREAVAGLRALGFRGANVTVPYKQSVMPHLDTLTEAARSIGAVNTILVEDDGSLTGDNTDARGFIADLREHGFEPNGTNVLVLGAGGSARAVAYGLADAGASAITLVNRTPSRAEEIVSALASQFPSCSLKVEASVQESVSSTRTTDLIVNCTSLGMSPNIEGNPWDVSVPLHPQQTVYDLVYNPSRTTFIKHVEANGARTIGGKGMLVWQGALAFKLWTGVKAPVDVMKTAVGL